jgi:hypothetical protein
VSETSKNHESKETSPLYKLMISGICYSDRTLTDIVGEVSGPVPTIISISPHPDHPSLSDTVLRRVEAGHGGIQL